VYLATGGAAITAPEMGELGGTGFILSGLPVIDIAFLQYWLVPMGFIFL